MPRPTGRNIFFFACRAILRGNAPAPSRKHAPLNEKNPETAQDELDRYWARFTSTDTMQPSRLFRFDARQINGKYAEFAINVKALDALQEDRVMKAVEHATDFDPIRQGF